MKNFRSWIQKMSWMQLIGASSTIIGIILIMIARRSEQKADQAKSFADSFTSFFTNSTGIWNPVIQFFGGEVHKEASKYDTSIELIWILGIVMAVLGAWALFWYRRRS